MHKNQAVSQEFPHSIDIAPKPPKRAPLPSQSEAFYRYRAQQASVIRRGQQSSHPTTHPAMLFILEKTQGPRQPLLGHQQLQAPQQPLQPRWHQRFWPQRQPTTPVSNAMSSPIHPSQRLSTSPTSQNVFALDTELSASPLTASESANVLTPVEMRKVMCPAVDINKEGNCTTIYNAEFPDISKPVEIQKGIESAVNTNVEVRSAVGANVAFSPSFQPNTRLPSQYIPVPLETTPPLISSTRSLSPPHSEPRVVLASASSAAPLSVNDTSYTIKAKTNSEVTGEFEPEQSIPLGSRPPITPAHPTNNTRGKISSFSTHGTSIKTSSAVNNEVKAAQGTPSSNIPNQSWSPLSATYNIACAVHDDKYLLLEPVKTSMQRRFSTAANFSVDLFHNLRPVRKQESPNSLRPLLGLPDTLISLNLQMSSGSLNRLLTNKQLPPLLSPLLVLFYRLLVAQLPPMLVGTVKQLLDHRTVKICKEYLLHIAVHFHHFYYLPSTPF